MSQVASPRTVPPPAYSSLATISRGLVQLLRRRAGRGPTEAKASWAGADTLLVLFSGAYTRVEKTLATHGREETALHYRHAMLQALEPEMRAVVEEALDRPVTAVLSCAHHGPDVMAVIFLFEPLGGSGSAEAGPWGAGDEPVPHPAIARPRAG